MRERYLFLALCLAYLVPVWAVEYLPTTDGPAHTYNAWVVRQHGNRAEHPWLDRYYEIDVRPLPNWLGHAVMAGLMVAVPPRIAEKLLVSGTILLFLAGVRFLAASADPARGWLAFLAFPLSYNRMFQLGFYNFCLGLALFLFAVGLWWREREAPGLKLALELNGLLLFTWLAHLVAHLLAMAALGALWLLTWRREGTFRKRHWVHLAILAPQVVLPLWYFSGGREVGMAWTHRPVWGLVSYLLRMEVVFSLRHGLLWAGTVLGVAFLISGALTLRGRLAGERRLGWREEDAFLLVSALFVILFLIAPDKGAEGTLLKPRIALAAPLVLLPWLAPGLGRRSRALAIAGLAVLALVHGALLISWYRGADREIRELVAGAQAIAPGTRVLPLLFVRDAEGWPTVLGHSFGYVAAEKGLLDWDNYEAAADYFPVRYRPGVRWPDSFTVEARPENFRPGPWRDEIDYIYCWKMRPGSKIARRIKQNYLLVAERGPARVYARKD